MQRAGSQVVCHSCDSYVREMSGAIWFPGLRAIWLHRSCSLFSSLVAAQKLAFLVCLLLLLQNRISLTLLPVFLIGMRLYTFFPFQTSQAGLEPVIVLSVEYLLLEAFTRSQLTLAS